MWVPNKTAHPYGDRWVAMTMDGLHKLVMTPGIGLQEIKVFTAIFKRLDYENFIYVAQVDPGQNFSE